MQLGSGPGWAVITGASSGFGAIFASKLAKRGLSLLLAGRDESRLSAVAHQVGQIAPGIDVELLVGDLGTDAGVDALAACLQGRVIEVLVNNAGFGTYGRFSELATGHEHDLVAVNVDALVRLTHAVLPGMLARGRGGILNVASTIAFQPSPYQATYGASKAFVLSLSQALWAETRGSGVTVTALCPGPTRTGFVDALGSDVSHTAVYRRLAAPEPVAAAGLRALERGRAVVVPGWRNRVAAMGGRLAPGWLSALIGRRLLQPAAATASGSRWTMSDKVFTFEINRTTSAPAGTLFRLETDGARWSEWAKPLIVQSSWERQGEPLPGGVGAVRKVGMWPVLMREKTIAYEQDRRHVYQQIGPPLPARDYRAEMLLTPNAAGGTDLRWTGSFTEGLPGTGPVMLFFLRNVVRFLSHQLVKAAEHQ
jgi:uncharacterized protein